MSLNNPLPIKPIFGGHEKFVFRHGWLKKGIDAVLENPRLFLQEDALIKLGVGKNMVHSIRHWCLAAGLLQETKTKGSTFHPLTLTPLASKLMLEWDPYLEDAGTLWLLHWQLVSNQTRCLVWYLLFSAYHYPEFDKTQLFPFIQHQFDLLGVKTTPGTIEREIDCCLRMYLPARLGKTASLVEENFDCPLAELDLFQLDTKEKIYRFQIGPKATLHPLIFGYALQDYLAQIVEHRRVIALEDCLYRTGSPGQAFKLDENSIVQYLEQLETHTQGAIRLQETIGLRQIYLNPSSNETYRFLADYYSYEYSSIFLR